MTLHWTVNTHPTRGLAQTRAWYGLSSLIRTLIRDTESIYETSVELKTLMLMLTRKKYILHLVAVKAARRTIRN